MRFDTHRISASLVQALQQARPLLEVTDDGGDIIHVRTARGEMVYIYLIEDHIDLLGIRSVVQDNTRAGVFSLFILWGEMLVPAHGTRYAPNDWMAALLALGGDKIYAYDPYGGDDWIYPVFFEGNERARYVHYGKPIHAARLNCYTIETRSPYINGVWWVADFETEASRDRAHRDLPVRNADALQHHYDVLGVARDATRATVKRAYRHLARANHPDLNASPDAKRHMQRINEAYRQVLAQFAEQG